MHPVRTDLFDLGFDLALGVVGWYMAHNPEKVARFCNFGKAPKTGFYVHLMQFSGWSCVASACFCAALFPFILFFHLKNPF